MELTKYLIASLAIQALLALMTSMLSELFGSSLAYPIALSFVLTLDYWLTSTWVFETRPVPRSALRFVTFQVANVILQSTVFAVVEAFFGLPWSVWITTALTMPLRFLVAKFWVYR